MQRTLLQQNIDQNNQQIAGFVAKAYQILKIPQFIKIIYWSSNGTQFTIKDTAKFQQIVLPRFFRHNKMNSFVRQLNMYGFHKTKHNNFKSTFKHPYFQKQKEQLIQPIQIIYRELLPFVKRKLKNNQQNQHQNNNDIKNDKIEQKRLVNRMNNHNNNNSQKQPEPTSVSLEKYFNFSNQFIGTTKMINYSLKKVSYNDFNNTFQHLEENNNQDCVSIENQIQKDQKKQDFDFFNFQNVSCFFSSSLNF